jgi:hypothetical protein
LVPESLAKLIGTLIKLFMNQNGVVKWPSSLLC